ncbi:phiSA1p31-related protein [Streptomyces hawaiiensis]|uniref:phiSA1p31-related protein n=1 Tax=Streptomyces hawaiiensis TaxID=67305 RepID=UPI00364BE1E8
MAFKVGDKVEHPTFGKGEVAFGPYEALFGTDHYLMAGEGGKHYVVGGGDLTPVSKFKVGDEVRSFGDDYTVLAGPFRGYTEWYVVEDEEGKALTSNADEMTAVEPTEPALKVGDRVRVVKDDPTCRTGEFVGTTGTVTRLNISGSRLPFNVRFDAGQGVPYETWNVAEVERVEELSAGTYEHNGVAYDLSARYVDRDGDYWTFKRIGDGVFGYCSGSNRDMSEYISEHGSTLRKAVRDYGPLTRV